MSNFIDMRDAPQTLTVFGGMSPETVAAFDLILTERIRQNAKWGEQNHDDEIWFAIMTEEIGEVAQAILHTRFGGKAGGTTEVELVHVAAVALQWLECIQRRNQK